MFEGTARIWAVIIGMLILLVFYVIPAIIDRKRKRCEDCVNFMCRYNNGEVHCIDEDICDEETKAEWEIR